ncbi:heterokaryon incompatibility protein-domain-containing protein, partial [Paraphoma chrysanthemicola]
MDIRESISGRGRIQDDEKVTSSTLIFRRTDAFEVLQQARGWIHQCQDHHTKCRARDSDAEGSGFVPTRLIRVNTVDGVLKSVRLREHGEIDSKSKYLTLSHCWGAAKSILLEQNSLTKFRSAIPLAQLPKTFKDAMLVTTQLGYEFVWIDSLCIIQDSNEDWVRESALMGEIYRNSACTIAALGAKDSNGGCFQERCALSFLGCRFGPDFVIMGERQQDWLHSRAWVLQERCLATRTLNFGANFVSYDCVEGSNDEMNWTQQMPTLKGRYSQLTIRNRGLWTKIEGEWRDSWLDDWWWILGEYTKCNLTYISDKWTAIQGLATTMADLNNVNIINGLWEPALAQELLWVADSMGSSRLSVGWPSWSWLSIDGAV